MYQRTVIIFGFHLRPVMGSIVKTNLSQNSSYYCFHLFFVIIMQLQSQEIKHCFYDCFDCRVHRQAKYLKDMMTSSMETFSALLAICVGIHLSPVNSPHKGQWRGALVFSSICVWINGWVNIREAGDLKRHRAHYIYMVYIIFDTRICRQMRYITGCSFSSVCHLPLPPDYNIKLYKQKIQHKII